MHWLKLVKQRVGGKVLKKQCADFPCTSGKGTHSRLAPASPALDAAFHPHKGAAPPPALTQ